MARLPSIYVCSVWTIVFCFIIKVRSLPPYTPPYTVLLHTDTGYVQHGDEGGLSLMCLKYTTIAEAIPPLTNIIRPVTGITILRCKTPNSTYIQAFEALNISTSNIRKMDISMIEKVPIPPRDYMTGLKLDFLSLRTEEQFDDVFRNARDFLEPLTNVSELILAGLRIPKLPYSMRVKTLTLYGKASFEEWGNCKEIEDFDHRGFGSVPRWPEECKKIRNLTIDGTQEANRVFENLTAAAPYLENVVAKACSIHELPIKFLEAAQRLKSLDLSENELYDQAFTQFPVMSSLKTLDLSENLYNGGFLKYMVPKLPALRSISMKHNQNFQGNCNSAEFSDFKEGIEHLKRSSFKEVSFFYSDVDLNCFIKAHFQNLTLLEFGYLTPRSLKLLDLPTSEAENLTIDFYVTVFDEIKFSRADYEKLQKENDLSPSDGARRHHLNVKTTYISCDCVHGWLGRALRHFPKLISMPNLRCNEYNGIEILDESPEKLECDKWEEDGCMLMRPWGEEYVDAECDNEVLPAFKYPVRGLNVSNLGLTKFYSELPSSVKWIDYRNNVLSSAGAAEVDELFKNGRRVWLKGNEIICDCGNSLLLDAIQMHSEQVVDYKELNCIGTGEPIHAISTTILCQTSLKVSLALLAALAGIIAVATLIFRRYAEEIRMFLFSRGLCLVCLRKEDFGDKPFDAFISFAHGDDEYVRDVLLPGLEESEEKFKVCVHYRDWQLGDWIPANIMHSVKQSKRTLILLSRSFVNSSWSALEFRYAKAIAAQDEHSRVLILVLDDVLSEDLDPELKAYISYNTYLNCDDPWFWEKLKYAMPHKNLKKKRDKPPKDVNLNENYAGNVMIAFPSNSNPLNNNTECSNS